LAPLTVAPVPLQAWALPKDQLKFFNETLWASLKRAAVANKKEQVLLWWWMRPMQALSPDIM
jgi:hypothetical protein